MKPSLSATLNATRAPRALIVSTLLVLLLAVPAHGVAAGFSVRDLFVGLDADLIGAEEPLSSEEKEDILRTGPERNESVCPADGTPSGSWYVIDGTETPTSMELRTCFGSTVVLRVYQRAAGGFIGAVISIMGNHGQSQIFRFFAVSPAGHVGKEVAAQALGFEGVSDNEFLPRSQYFAADENGHVALSYSDDGSFEAQRWTFNEPRWDSKDIVRQIRFVWDGTRFRKRVRAAK